MLRVRTFFYFSHCELRFKKALSLKHACKCSQSGNMVFGDGNASLLVG